MTFPFLAEDSMEVWAVPDALVLVSLSLRPRIGNEKPEESATGTA
jgi:hypothetical protein